MARAQDGHGSLLVVEGPAGIGKSALIGAARAVSDAAGTRTLRARGGELERDFAFGVVRQLLEPALAEAPARARDDLLQGPAGVAGRLLGLPGRGPGRPRRGRRARRLVHRAARPLLAVREPRRRPPARAHRRRRALGRRAVPALPGLPAAAAGGAVARARGRHAPGGRERRRAAARAAARRSARARPAPGAALGRRGRAPGRRTASGTRPTPAFAAACRRTTGGVPFLVRELVEALREEGVAPTAAEAPRVEALGARTVGRAMLVRLSRLPAVAVRLAQAVAVLETAELAQAADLAGVDADAAAAAADLLVAAGILGPRRPLAFAHPIVRAGILEEVPPAERMRAHRRAAELLAVREDSGERVAEHLLATEPAGDAWTVARLTEAAPRRRAPRRAGVGGELPAPRPGRAAAARARAPGSCSSSGVAEATAGQPEGEAHLREALAGGRRRRRAPRRRARPRPRPRSPRADRRRPSRSSTSPPRGWPTTAAARACCSSRWPPAPACSTRPRRRAWPRACAPCAAPPTTRTSRARSWRWRRSSPSTPTSRRRPASRWPSARSPPARGSSPSRPTCRGSPRRRSRSSGPMRTPRRRSRSTPAWPRAARPATPPSSA